MPIMKEHREGIKRDASDLNNCGKSRYADASAAAAFIECFLEKRTEDDKRTKDPKWAHIDFSNTSWNSKVGCTGFGARLLLEYLLKSSQEPKSATKITK